MKEGWSVGRGMGVLEEGWGCLKRNGVDGGVGRGMRDGGVERGMGVLEEG